MWKQSFDQNFNNQTMIDFLHMVLETKSLIEESP